MTSICHYVYNEENILKCKKLLKKHKKKSDVFYVEEGNSFGLGGTIGLHHLILKMLLRILNASEDLT